MSRADRICIRNRQQLSTSSRTGGRIYKEGFKRPERKKKVNPIFKFLLGGKK